MRCFKCKKKNVFSIHHIDGNGSQLPEDEQNNSKENLIILCLDCHDLIEGICSQCFLRENCFDNKFKECWGFEDALPPIHFKRKEDFLIDSEKLEDSFTASCPKCNSNKIARISKWTYDGVYKSDNNYIALYKCKSCKFEFKRTLNGLYERAIDNLKVPIEIKDWNIAVKVKYRKVAKSRFLESESDEISDIEDDEEIIEEEENAKEPIRIF